jgi:hypothetical protein
MPSTGTGKKRGTATQTAPNQTAGPLCASSAEKEENDRQKYHIRSKERQLRQ